MGMEFVLQAHPNQSVVLLVLQVGGRILAVIRLALTVTIVWHMTEQLMGQGIFLQLLVTPVLPLLPQTVTPVRTRDPMVIAGRILAPPMLHPQLIAPIFHVIQILNPFFNQTAPL